MTPRNEPPGKTRTARCIAGAVVVAGLLVTGCQAPGTRTPQPDSVAGQPSPAPTTDAALISVYRVDASRSEARVLVYRGGPLARFGHNHVMVAPVHGEIREGDTAAASGFHLEIEAQAMQVDPPAARAEEGEAFSSEVSSENRDGTRANMLGPRLLDADQYPKILIDSAALTGPRWNPDVEANVTLRGATAAVAFPAAVVEHDGTLTIVARLSLRVSDFGIEPFTALGGALQVQDRLDVRIRLVAQREAAQ